MNATSPALNTPKRSEEDKPNRCDWRDFIKVGDDTPEYFIKALDKHFRSFVAPGSDCPGCGADLTHMLFGTFRWGVVHGHGNCRTCGWPAAAHHFIRDEDGKEIATLRNFVLAAHPDFVKKADKK